MRASVSTNRARTAPVEIELGSGEQLVDLADSQVMPMDLYAEQDGWRKVRFIAADVPAMGYKAYGIRGWNAAAQLIRTLSNRLISATISANFPGIGRKCAGHVARRCGHEIQTAACGSHSAGIRKPSAAGVCLVAAAMISR